MRADYGFQGGNMRLIDFAYIFLAIIGIGIVSAVITVVIHFLIKFW